MAKFRNKPVVVEAVRWTGQRQDYEFDYVHFENSSVKGMLTVDGCFVIDALEGKMVAHPGDWIIKGVKDEYYPCRPDIFEQTYEAVERGMSEHNCGSWECMRQFATCPQGNPQDQAWAKVKELEAQLAKKDEELAELEGYCKEYSEYLAKHRSRESELEKEIAQRDERIAELEGALEKYGGHVIPCPMYPVALTKEQWDSFDGLGVKTVNFCTCGLDAALKDGGKG